LGVNFNHGVQSYPLFKAALLKLRQIRNRESLGLKPLLDSPEKLHSNYNKLERMGTSSLMGGAPLPGSKVNGAR
jgi:hypothetical protein